MSLLSEIRRKAIMDRFGVTTPDVVDDSGSLGGATPPVLKTIGDTSPDDKEMDLSTLFKPHTEAMDKYNDLLGQYPTEKPSLMRAIVAGGLGLGKKGSFKDQQAFLNEPQDTAVADWKNKSEAAYKTAQLENNQNVNDRYIASNVISAKVAADRLVAQQKIADANNASREKIATDRDALVRAKQDGTTFKVVGNKFIATRPDGTVYDTGIDAKNYTPIDVANITSASRERVSAASNEVKKDIADDKGWSQPVMIEDQNNPGKQIAVQTHLGTGEVREVKMGGKNVGPITKPSSTSRMTQPTNLKDIQTKTQETINLLGEIIDDKGNFTKNATAATGPLHVLGTDRIPLTPGYSGAKSFERLKSMLVIELIGEMKNQSRTGATGFGQLSRAELQVLENSAGKLDRSQDPEVLRTELVRIREKLKKILLPDDGSNPTVTQPRSKMQQDIDAALQGQP